MAGRHTCDAPPVEGGRWPVSTVFRPPLDSPISRRLDELTAEAAEVAGPRTGLAPTADRQTGSGPAGHWQTGQRGSAHFTIRALEKYRAAVAVNEPVIQRYASALRRTSAQIGALTFELTGLTLTQGTVMACARPLDDQADRFMDLYAEELGADAWYERDHYFRRDIWYVNLLHFTTTIPDPAALIDWVAARRHRTFGQVTVDTAEVVRFRLVDGPRPHMRPEVLAVAPLRQVMDRSAR
ncbi:hypothetical protein Kfla_6334 [Kribbella flavida DSM 17836]|uniref:Uncharacterized protein n=1 Tax=Kribbella flavida (strain DSM 17836 / JCM 10339 / NBRC 14399) TaxID=479435 RepID=D2PWV6_KRIFD|nr:hypothetical protein [Kribbella flavida]ADB35336.1 hypothetical protein Kfla_6334 [Kribbella flavida DSM 17836]